MATTLRDSETEQLLAFARMRIHAYLTGEAAPRPPRGGGLDEPAGAFVTLREAQGGRLRGCIGQIEAVGPVADAVAETAISAAVRDPRFPPLEVEELPAVQIEISVLSPLRVAQGLEEIAVGTHGIYLRNRGCAGLLLPQVASERGWDVETFLTQTCYKAGLGGECWRDPATQIQIFSAQIFSE